jgi:two-component system, chemotaxis family, chemotaxis protein CheY
VKKILVVDDSETIRQQVSRALEQAGFEAIEAGDGIEGLEKLGSHEVSLVLLDVNMPLLNGLDMLDRMKNSPATAKVPVLMLTTEVHQAMIQRARQAGAKGWIIKPVKMQDLVVAVVKLTS